MRLRTLPVSVAGVLTAWAWAVADDRFVAAPAVLCMAFALLAQIASNFANEYYDFLAGRDRSGREGPRRGVTEGDITPAAMRRATLITIGAACCVGLSLVAWSGWWLIAVGVLVAAGVFAYSTGPYPLSTHGWGEVAVVFFFGIIPVNFTYYLAAGGAWTLPVALSSVAIGLMGANVLIINNYRDMEDDCAVGKRTLCVRIGRRRMALVYLSDVIAAAALLAVSAVIAGSYTALIAPVVYLACGLRLHDLMRRRLGAMLNPLLGGTALSMFVASILLLLVFLCH